jgi:hypothetical protein
MSAQAKAKFAELSKLAYKAQMVYFLNGYLGGNSFSAADANVVWDFYKAFVELDKLGADRKGEAGNELDQFWSAKFLEDNDKAITALERKAALKVKRIHFFFFFFFFFFSKTLTSLNSLYKTIDVDASGKMSLIEYLTWKYKKSIDEVAVLPQGDNAAAIAAAQKRLDAVLVQLKECEERLEAQKAAKLANERAIAALEKEEAELSKLQEELKAAVAALEAEQKLYNDKCNALQNKINDPSTSSMQKSKASNELAQLKSEDPLPLRRAKITQEAAVRKTEKQLKQVALAKEEAARKQAELEKAIRDLEAAYTALEGKIAEAQKELERAKSSGTGGQGAVYALERQLFDADAFLPTSKQRHNHKQPFQFVVKSK